MTGMDGNTKSITVVRFSGSFAVMVSISVSTITVSMTVSITISMSIVSEIRKALKNVSSSGARVDSLQKSK